MPPKLNSHLLFHRQWNVVRRRYSQSSSDTRRALAKCRSPVDIKSSRNVSAHVRYQDMYRSGRLLRPCHSAKGQAHRDETMESTLDAGYAERLEMAIKLSYPVINVVLFTGDTSTVVLSASGARNAPSVDLVEQHFLRVAYRASDGSASTGLRHSPGTIGNHPLALPFGTPCTPDTCHERQTVRL